MLAGQELGKETQNDQVKAKAALLGVPLHDPVKNPMKGFAGYSNREDFVVSWLVDMKRRIVRRIIRLRVARRDHKVFGCFFRAIWRRRWRERFGFAAR